MLIIIIIYIHTHTQIIIHFCVNIHHFRVLYFETSAPQLKIASNFIEIVFKFAKIEYF